MFEKYRGKTGVDRIKNKMFTEEVGAVLSMHTAMY
jgi:hypothetical protein